MSKSRAGALITLNSAARQAGIGPQLAVQLANDGEFPHLVELRGRRYVGREQFQRWLTLKLREPLPPGHTAPTAQARPTVSA